MTNESDIFHPSPEVSEGSWAENWEEMERAAAEDLEGYWAGRASELEWSKPWDQVIDDSNKPFYKWFVGGETNIVTNAVDRHIVGHRKNKLALLWRSEDDLETRTFSYFSLNREVVKMANILKAMGVQKGDRVTIYLPRIPEVVFAMLACAKLGAVHSVIFAGFSSDAIASRIDDSESKIVITADGSWINGSVFPLKDIVDEAVRFSPTVENVIVVRRTGTEVHMDTTRDHWYHDLEALPISRGPCETVQVDSEHPLYILYTSGSTGKPKAILHTHGGYMVGTYTTLKDTFDIREDDRFWCTADAGWVTGHSYVVYGPLLTGATTFMYEGGPTYPHPDRWWKLIEHYGITTFYTAPTAIRSLMRFGDAWVNRHDLSSLRLLGSVGEPINPAAWEWFYNVVGGGKAPIMDTWWQTETGMFQITGVPSMPQKPGSAGRPVFGQEAEIVDEQGNPVPDGTEGFLTLKNPWPAMARTIYKDDQRFIDTYWSTYPGRYMSGDAARRDEDGYFWVIGRTDDVIKVSGHRLGTAEVESAVNSHAAVNESAAIAMPHEVKGNSIRSYIVLNQGYAGGRELTEELRAHVASHLSPIAKPDEIEYVEKLPKTRSGKILRRVLRARALGKDEGDLSTLEE